MAVISDIHANLEALTAVFQAIDALRPPRIICLGDLVGYGANPNECVQLIRARAIPCVAGNHDRVAAGLKEPTDFSDVAARAIRWTKRRLRSEHKRFLRDQPLLRQIGPDTVAVHGALHPRPNEDTRIRCDADAIQSFNIMQRDYPTLRICFFGHTHRAGVWEQRDGEAHLLEAGEITLRPDARYLINPGSVGQSRDRDHRAAFLLYEPHRGAIRFCRVPYDIETHRRKLLRARLVRRRSRLRRLVAWVRDRLISAAEIASPDTEPANGTIHH